MTHEEVASYNWDDGLSRIWPVVESSQTEMATAVLVFWRIEGPWILNDPASPPAEETLRMASVLRDRIVGGFYYRGSLRYDPIADNQLNRLQVVKFQNAGVPAILLGQA